MLIVSSKPHCAGGQWKEAEEEMSWQVGKLHNRREAREERATLESVVAKGGVRTEERAAGLVHAQEHS